MYRVGMGSDQHRYRAGDCIRLGGVVIPAEFTVVAHSDGDVFLHALTDALLGAVAGGDIGELFPDTTEVNKGRDSVEFLEAAFELIRDKGYELVNIDSTIQAERPRLAEYKRQIAGAVAKVLKLKPEFVSVKAKTAEGMDAVGRCEGIRVDVVVLVRRVGG